MDEKQGSKAIVSVGAAPGPHGSGIAYAVTVSGRGERKTYRVPFACVPLPALRGRDVTYAAVTAVAAQFVRTGVTVSELRIADERLVTDVRERGTLPQALAMPYVALRCTLNRLHDASVAICSDGVCRDLEARARAELILDAAA